MLEVRSLEAFYGDVQVLWGVDLAARPGSIVSVIGPNGAGKTTLLRAIMGLTTARGAAELEGRPVLGRPPEAMAALGVTMVPEGGRVFPDMTCRDNLLLGAHLVRDRRRVRSLLDGVEALFPLVAERAGQKASTLSGGERQLLALGRALMSGPKVLLLDEPSLGLHPIMSSLLFGAVKDIRDQGVAVLLVEQKVGFALEISDHAHVLENGRVALSGPGPELLGDPHVRKAYLAV